MSTTQYIGSRYVPIFADPMEWNKEYSYEPLTIVMYQGNSYTSRQSVPIGVDISNNSYWALTSNYNAQIESYRTEVKNYVDKVETFDSKIESNANSIINENSRAEAAEATLETKISDETSRAEAAEATLETKISDETSRAEAAEATLETKISDETSRARSAENTIASDLSNTTKRVSVNETAISNLNTTIAGYSGSVPIFVSATDAMTDTSKVYVLTTNKHIYTYVNNAWTDSGVVYSQQDDVLTVALWIVAENYSSWNANSAPDNSLVLINLSGGSSVVSGLPFSTYPTMTNTVSVLKTYKHTSTSVKYQTWTTESGTWIREYAAGNWLTWVKNTYSTSYVSDASNKLLTDANNAPDNSVIMLNYAADATNVANLPTAKYPKSASGYTMSLLKTYRAPNKNFKIQEFIFYNEHWYRQFDTSWHPWFNVDSGVLHVYDLATLLKYIESYTGTIYVHSGTYDFVSTLGSSFFDDYTSSSKRGYAVAGTLVCAPDAKFVCNYTGSNTNAQNLFSPFTLTDINSKIIGLNLVVSGVRYAIHDDVHETGLKPYVHEYVNCNITNNNTSDQAGYLNCVGGGFGSSGNVIFDGCIFKSAQVQSNIDNRGIVSYHNTPATSGASTLTVKNCLFDGYGTVRVSWCGTSTDVSNAIVTNNRLGSAPIHIAERTQDTVKNFELTTWNNVQTH